jgi:hypothetical protein
MNDVLTTTLKVVKMKTAVEVRYSARRPVVPTVIFISAATPCQESLINP